MRNDILDKWARKLAKRRNRSFLEASMAAAALVSMADEDVRLSELLALDDVLGQIDRLQSFEPNEAVDLHRGFTEKIQVDSVTGRTHALEVVAGFEGNQDDRLSILYVAAVIARADLDLSAGGVLLDVLRRAACGQQHRSQPKNHEVSHWFPRVRGNLPQTVSPSIKKRRNNNNLQACY